MSIVISQSHLDEWFAHAINDPAIRRFYSAEPHFTPPQLCDSGNWNRVFFLKLRALLKITICRATNTVSIQMYNTGTPLAGAEIIREGMTTVSTMLPIRRIDTAVAQTNEKSLRINRKLFGEPWGICPGNFWDHELGQWVDSHHFSAGPETLLARMMS